MHQHALTRYAPPEVRMARWVSDTNTGCWIWQGYTNPGGYGKMGNGLAHRLVYEYFVGPIPKGKQLDHTCRVRNCVNPAHLEPVTALQNARRSFAARGILPQKVCGKGHVGQFTFRRSGPRKGQVAYCKVCRNEWRRRRYAEGRYS